MYGPQWTVYEPGLGYLVDKERGAIWSLVRGHHALDHGGVRWMLYLYVFGADRKRNQIVVRLVVIILIIAVFLLKPTFKYHIPIPLIIVVVDANGGLHARRMWVFTPSACPPWWLPAKPPPPQRWGGPHAWTLVTT